MNNGLAVSRVLPTPPNWGTSTIALLAACANGTAISGFTNLQAGIVTAPSANPRDVCQAGFDANSAPVLLTPLQAASILALDPLYPGGQSIDPSGNGTSRRFSLLDQLGEQTCFPKSDPNGSACQPSIGNVTTKTQGQGSSGNITTGVKVANSNVQTGGANLTLGIPIIGGITIGGSTADTVGTENSTGAQINYSASTISSRSMSVTLTANIQDSTYTIQLDPNNTSCLQDNPLVIIPYQDSTFSSLLFRDLCAAGPPVTQSKREVLESLALINGGLPEEIMKRIARMEQIHRAAPP